MEEAERGILGYVGINDKNGWARHNFINIFGSIIHHVWINDMGAGGRHRRGKLCDESAGELRRHTFDTRMPTRT